MVDKTKISFLTKCIHADPDGERNHFYSKEFRNGYLRFSIGLESPEDIINDLKQALEKCGL